MTAEAIIGKLRRAKQPPHEQAKTIADLIWGNEARENSQWVLDELGDPYLLRKEGLAFPISLRSNRFSAALTYLYGLTRSDPLTKQIVDRLAARAYHESKPITTARFSHWTGKELLISTYSGECIVLDGVTPRPTVEPNGAHVLFKDDDLGIPITDIDYGDHGLLFDTVTKDINFVGKLGASPEDQRYLLFLWFLATCMPETQNTKPLLILEGDKGSGKTSVVKHLQYIARGRHLIHLLGKTDQAELPIKILRSPICCLDNMDKPIPWLTDALCSYSTAGRWTRRKLYTDTEQVTIKPQSFIVITTRRANLFAREDLADRSIFLSLGRRSEGFEEATLIKNLLDHRPKLFGELLFMLNKIVKGYHNPPKIDSRYRMADFSLFCYIAGKAIGLSTEHVDRLLLLAEASRHRVIAATNTTIQVVISWLNKHPESQIAGTAQDILDGWIEDEAQKRGEEVPTTRAIGRALSQAMKQENPPIKVSMERLSGNKKFYVVSLPKLL